MFSKIMTSNESFKGYNV